MNKVILALLLLLVGYWSALNQEKLKSWLQSTGLHDSAVKESKGPETAAASDKDDSPPAPAPPVAAPPPFVPTPSHQAYLEDDIYYTKERLSQMVDQGVVVIPEGSEVRVVGEINGQLIIESEGKRLLASPRKLTNNPDEILAFSPQGRTTAANAVEQPTPELSSASSAEATKLREANALKRQVISAKMSDLGHRIAVANSQIKDLKYQSRRAQSKGRPSTYNDRTIATLQAQISAMEAERSRLNIEQAGIAH